VTTTARAAAALLLHAALERSDDPAARGLWLSLGDDVLHLEVGGWVDEGGPDGEQLYCLSDLLSARFSADPVLRGRTEALVHRDDAALRSLDALARWFRRAGSAGAARWCVEAAEHVRTVVPGRSPVPVRPHPAQVGRRAPRPASEWPAFTPAQAPRR
jgi:hypothetical protein